MGFSGGDQHSLWNRLSVQLRKDFAYDEIDKVNHLGHIFYLMIEYGRISINGKARQNISITLLACQEQFSFSSSACKSFIHSMCDRELRHGWAQNSCSRCCRETNHVQ